LFPALAVEVGPLNEKHRRLVAVPGLVPVEQHVRYDHCGVGRKPADRSAPARAFIARVVWDMPTTRDLVDRLKCAPTLRRLCGWSRVLAVPDETTFSRAFGGLPTADGLSAYTRRWSRQPLPTRLSGTSPGILRRASTETKAGSRRQTQTRTSTQGR